MTRTSLVAGIAATFGMVAASAQTFPSRPITLVVPFAVGGSTDLVARLLAERMGPVLGTTVVVENRAGAGGVTGAEWVARAKPDGYTLLMATVSTHAASPALRKSMPYDPVKDFQPITNVMSVPSVFTVHPKVGARTMQQFIALAKASPGKYSYASPGHGSLGHVNIEQFSQLSGIQLRHVPYKGSGPAMTDALAGVVDVMPDNLPSLLPHIESGKLRPLAVLSSQRVRALGKVPTYREMGFEAMGDGGWFGLVAPAGTPRPVVDKLMRAAHTAMRQTDFRVRTAGISGIPMLNTPEQFAEQIETALAKYRAVVIRAGLKLE